MNRLVVAAISIANCLFLCPHPTPGQERNVFGCPEVPRADALPSLCAPPTSEMEAATAAIVVIALRVPEGTPLRIALDQRTRVARVGEAVHGKLVEPVYAFDQQVIPAGSSVSGRVTKIDGVPPKVRALSYSNGNFTPFHRYEVSFDELALPDGRTLKLKTATSLGSAEPMHLVASQSKLDERKKENVAARVASDVKKEASAQIQSDVAQIKAPNLMHRLRMLVYAQSPVRRQYIEKGTRFNAALEDTLEFGETTRTPEQLASLGRAPEPDSLMHARLGAEISSETAVAGSTVSAVLTEPVFSQNHVLLLPANSKLLGEVQQAKAARKFHRNGELRIAFNRIELPSGVEQAMQGTLEGMEVDRSAHLALDEEGGARATTPKTRYLATSFSLAMLAAVSRPDVEHGTTDAAGDADKRAGAGISGSHVAGSLISLAVRSQPVSMAFGALGATQSVYSNFLSRGKEVDLKQNTPLEISFGPPHDEKRKTAQAKPKY
ncbi:MAG: hypothetical protein JSS69_04770 [Acidobacteria bacterium]|nr:hypothetical protein [Acidobacteriota bacterium]MBS1865211.1 hypothetical protein [Acidobacteriota bacterium]